MKRFGRWLFNGLAILSGLLLSTIVAVALLRPMIGSHLYNDARSMPNGQFRDIDVRAERGGFSVYYSWRGTLQDRGRGSSTEFAGFRFQLAAVLTFHFSGPPARQRAQELAARTAPPQMMVDIFVPYWQLAALTGILPAIALLLRLWRAKRRPPGTCVACGYDLRATPDRCPECGTIPVAKGIA